MTRLIVDTDTAQDDAFSLLLALRTPGVQLEAITVVTGNVPFEQQVENALYAVEVGGRGGQVPVHPGCDRPLLRRVRVPHQFLQMVPSPAADGRPYRRA